MPNYDGADFIEEKKVDSIISRQENPSSDQVSTKASELETAKAEMGEVRQENERLKTVLQHIKKDYQSLQLRFFDIVKQDHQDPKKLIASSPAKIKKLIARTDDKNSASKHDHDQAEESELVSLSLGRSPRSEAKNVTAQDASHKNIRDQNHDQDHHHYDHDLKANLTLGLGSEMQLSTELVTDPCLENSSEEVKELAEAQASNGDHALQSNNTNSKTPKNDGDDHDVSHEQPPAKRARVSVRARCDTPTMSDGCQWRKYGQKIAKGNPRPRAYYRCTVAPSCPVRKQVQRCAEDTSILITTYEGTHNHPLSATATAMASTTSAAASMLLSGSSTSSDPTSVGFSTTNATPAALNGLNFGHFDAMRTKAQFYLPNSSTTSSPLFPTITLDLTASPISSSSSSSHFNRSSLSSSLARIPSTSLSFGNSSEPNILPTLWGNGSSSYFGYGNQMLPFDKAPIGSFNLGKQSQEFLFQRSAEKISSQGNIPFHESLTETLTKAITSDPGAFKSVIAAAISSMVGRREIHHGKLDGMEKPSQGLTLGEQAAAAVSHNNIPLTQNGKGLASSYFNRLSSSSF